VNEFGFTGRYLDKETGLYYFRARYYSGSLGRFVSRDPLEYVDGTLLYMAYFVPNLADPSGMAAYGLWVDGTYSQEALSNVLEKGNKKCDAAIEVLSGMSDDEYGRYQAAGKIIFDKESFSGTRQELIEKIQREKTLTKFETADHEDPANTLDVLMAKVTAGSAGLTEKYDDVGMAVHGQYDNRTKKWNGKVSIGGAGVDRDSLRLGFSNACRGPGGNLLAYCGQTKGTEQVIEEGGLERLGIDPPKVFRKWTETNGNGEEVKCYGLKFIPWHLKKDIK